MKAYPFALDACPFAGHFRPIAKALIVLGTAIIFGASALAGGLPEPWFFSFGQSGLATFVAILVTFAALSATWLRAGEAALMSLISLSWMAAALATGWSIAVMGPETGLAVSLIEAIVLSVASFVLASNSGRYFLTWALAVMVVLFGVVHLMMPDVIASLIPDFIPFAALWPYVTGTILAGAGVAIFARHVRGTALMLIALMFLAWIPLVHVPRLFGSFTVGEVTFAATAVALIGALILCVATDHPGSPSPLVAG